MKIALRTIIVFLLCISFSFRASSQAITSPYYPFSVTTGTITPAIGFTTLLGTYYTNAVSNLTSFGGGFEFNFAGQTYNSFCVSSSGWIRLGSIGTQYYTPNIGNTTNWPIIAPYLSYLTTSSTGSVSYQLVGTAPNRVCVVQWRNMTHTPYIVTPVTFEAQLYENSGKIYFVYGSLPTDSYGYAVGIGASFNAVNSFASIAVMTPATSSIAQYSINSMSTSSIAAGTVFRFIPDSIPSVLPINIFSSPSAACISLGWEDASTTETYYEIWRSSDSITYTLHNVQVSSSETTIGTIYSFVDTSLMYNTIYHYRILSRNFGATPVQWLSITDTTLLPSLSGVKQIPGDYPSIGAAFDDIKCKRLSGPLILELMSSYSQGSETYPIVFPGDTLTSQVNTVTLRPDTNVMTLQFNLSVNTPLFDFNKSSNCVIDGRPAGMGNVSVMTITNNSSNAPAIRFVNDAKNIYVVYCSVLGSNNTTVNGVIQIAGTNYTNGNDNIIIDHCEIGQGTSRPINLIYSVGTVGKENDSITISNCLLHDFNRSMFFSTTTCNALYVGAGNTEWTIDSNSFYHTSTSVPTLNGTLRYIAVDNISGNHFVIKGNHLGGTAPGCSGNAILFTGSSAINFLFLNCSNQDWSFIEGNTIANISTNTTSFVRGINVAQGKIDIGSQTGNMIGSIVGGYSLDLPGGDFAGIASGSNDTIRITNNIVCGIKVGESFVGISVSGSVDVLITNNVVGHPLLPNSILGTGPYSLQGIDASFLNGEANVENNIVANLTLQNQSYGYNRRVGGIICHDGTAPTTQFNLHIRQNRIYSLHSEAADLNANSLTYCVCGIYLASEEGTSDIMDNMIYDLTATASQTNMSAHGIIVNTIGTSYLNMERNLIHSISLENSTSSARVSGITCINGSHNIINNMICMGIASNGASLQGAPAIRCVHSFTGSGSVQNNILNNSFYVGGFSQVQSHTSFVIDLDDNSPDSIFNNIICNTRYDTLTTTLHHYGLISPGSSPMGSNYNLFYITGPYSSYANNNTTLAAWQATGHDLFSISGDPAYINPVGDTASFDLHLGSVTWAEGMGAFIASVPLDYDNDVRSLFSPVDIGADCGNFLSTSLHATTTSNINSVSAFPNPFINTCTITAPSNAPLLLHLCIRTVTGAILFEKELINSNGSFVLTELSGFSSGDYFIELSGINFQAIVKVKKLK